MTAPPALARALLRLLPLGPRRAEVERDIDEVFVRHVARHGVRAGRRRYWKETLALVRWRSSTTPTARGPFLSGIGHDIRHSARALVHRPAYASLAVLTLALGIGATTVMFSVVHGVLLKPLPVPEPSRLMRVWETTQQAPQGTIASAANYASWRDANDVFDHLAIVGWSSPTLSTADAPRRLAGRLVSANFLETVGLEPVLGRDFRTGDDQPGGDPVAMVSASLWRLHFGSDPGVIGTTIQLSTGPHTVIGVLPSALSDAGFNADIFTALVLEEGDWLQYRGRHSVNVVGRLKTGVSPTQAQSQMDQIAARLAREYPDTNDGYGVLVEPMKGSIVSSAEQPLLMLLAAVGLVLLVACANVANLTLARGVGRQGELALCAALGAGRTRILRRLVAESALVAAVGGSLGVIAAFFSVNAVVALLPASMPRLNEIAVSGPALAFGLAAVVLAVIVAGVLPAVRATRGDLGAAAGHSAPRHTAGRSEQQLRDVFVVVELALAVVLLVGAGLFLRSLIAMATVNLGVSRQGVMTIRSTLPEDPYGDPEAMRAVLTGMLDRARQLPDIETAAIASHLPLANQSMASGFSILGGEQGGANGPQGSFRIVSPDYFRTLAIPLVDGRGFSPRDRIGQQLVVVVNLALASQYFPDGALGRRISYRLADDTNEPVWAEVVGVVDNVRHFGPASPPVPEIYEPLAQAEETFQWVGRSLALAVRTSGPMAPLGPALRRIVRDADARLPVGQVETLDEFLSRSTAGTRFYARLLGVFSTLAVLLASVGVYGVLSLNVRLRTREIGLRQALGADRSDLVWSVVRSGFRLALVGIAIGLGAATLLTRYVEGLLFDVRVTDPWTFALVPVILLSTACVACWVPARRAARVEPIEALRET